MYRATPKIVMLVLIAAVVGAIYYVTQGGGTVAPHDDGVVYVNPNFGTK
jgi:hypothetical protein